MNKKEIRNELLISLKMMIENIEALPQDIMSQPVNHYDLAGALILVYELMNIEEEKQE